MVNFRSCLLTTLAALTVLAAIPVVAGPNVLLIPFRAKGLDEGTWKPNFTYPTMAGKGVHVTLSTFKATRKGHIRFVTRMCNPAAKNWSGEAGLSHDFVTLPVASYSLAAGACSEFEAEFPKKARIVFVSVEQMR